MESIAPSGEATLTLPDGRVISLPYLEGTSGPGVVDVSKLFMNGVFTLDPGFTSTSSCVSKITYIDGEAGKLMYRGYPIEELAEKCTYLEVCYLLLYGELPSQEELQRFDHCIKKEMCIHRRILEFYGSFSSDAHPMAIMVGVVGALSAFLESDTNILTSEDREAAAIRIIAKFPMIAAVAYRTAYGLPVVYPSRKFSYAKNFLYMMFADPMDDEFEIKDSVVDALDKILILHADHEQNASTATVRIAGSSMANPFACIAAGIASLWGPMHGGANEAVMAMLEKIHTPDNIDQAIEDAKTGRRRLMGFGHRVYKNFDPRSRVMRDLTYTVIRETESDKIDLINLAIQLERKALEDPYFIAKKLYPNVDYYSGIALEAMGIPRDMFTVIFALGRCIGWISQWHEMMSEKIKKIGRPRQLYIGYAERTVPSISERGLDQRISQKVIDRKNKTIGSPRKRNKH